MFLVALSELETPIGSRLIPDAIAYIPRLSHSGHRKRPRRSAEETEMQSINLVLSLSQSSYASWFISFSHRASQCLGKSSSHTMTVIDLAQIGDNDLAYWRQIICSPFENRFRRSVVSSETFQTRPMRRFKWDGSNETIPRSHCNEVVQKVFQIKHSN